jgi:hypothetical protein
MATTLKRAAVYRRAAEAVLLTGDGYKFLTPETRNEFRCMYPEIAFGDAEHRCIALLMIAAVIETLETKERK